MDKTFKAEYDLEFQSDSDIPDEELTEDMRKTRDLAALTASILAERVEAIANRKREVDDRLITAARSYKGVQDSAGDDTLERGFSMPKVYNRVYHNITRQITNDGVSQLGDLLFPSDDKNYGVRSVTLTEPPLALANEPATDSKGEPLLDEEGTPLTNMQAHNRRVERVRRKAKRMFNKIDSSLISARYPSKGRQCIRDAGIYGTGILKAPVPNKKASTWAKKKGGAYALKPTNELSPDVKCVSPFDFFPDMSATEPSEWAYTWERSYILPAALQDMGERTGFNKEAIKQVLEVGTGTAPSSEETRDTAAGTNPNESLSKGRYALWERHGHIERSKLVAAGVNVSGKAAWVRCIIYVINDKVLNVSLAPYAKDETVYSVFNWDEDPLSVFGFGIPHLMNDPAHVYNSAWQMTLDNAGVSTMPQVVIDITQIKPADGSNDYTIHGGKVWHKSGNTYSNEQIAKPFELFAINQDIQQLFGLMDKARNDAYELTGVTRVEKSQQMNDNAPLTLGATQIQQNNSSVTRRSQARRYDDQITDTLVTRFYDYFMQFEEDDDIKAAMVIEARGSTILLAKELQASNLITFFQMTQGGTIDGVKALPLLRAIATSMQHPDGQFIETDEVMQQREEEAANQEQPQDPTVVAEARKADIAEANVELAQAKLKLESQIAEAEFALKSNAQQMEFELEYAKLDAKARAELGKSQAAFTQLEYKANFDVQKMQTIEQNKRDMSAAKISVDRERDLRTEGKTATELAIRKQAEDRQDAELNHKITTGNDGI